MSLEKGFNIVDNALSMAVKDLEQKGMPIDEAHIALIIRLRALVSPELLKVADMLNDDPELYSAINGDESGAIGAVVG